MKVYMRTHMDSVKAYLCKCILISVHCIAIAARGSAVRILV